MSADEVEYGYTITVGYDGELALDTVSDTILLSPRMRRTRKVQAILEDALRILVIAPQRERTARIVFLDFAEEYPEDARAADPRLDRTVQVRRFNW